MFLILKKIICPQEVLESMGLHLDEENVPYHDYDGEFQQRPERLGKGRLYKGYFGLGCILKSATDPNALVIPGMMHRLHDLLFSVVLRAQEYQLKKKL